MPYRGGLGFCSASHLQLAIATALSPVVVVGGVSALWAIAWLQFQMHPKHFAGGGLAFCNVGKASISECHIGVGCDSAL